MAIFLYIKNFLPVKLEIIYLSVKVAIKSQNSRRNFGSLKSSKNCALIKNLKIDYPINELR